MRPRVYVESTIISYLTARPSREVVLKARQQITQDWWASQRSSFQLFASPLVRQEVARGDPEAAERRVSALAGVPLLELTSEAKAVAKLLIGPGMVPHMYSEDALHIAIAVVHGMEYLLTWNFTHIANATARNKYEPVLRSTGYEVPIICTPEELLQHE